MIDIVTSIAPIAAGKKAWFVDIWGVMHNGIAPFDTAVEACRTFRQHHDGIVILVSNAPRPNTAVQAQLDRIGVAREAYDAIVSSGDTSRALIAALDGAPIFHLGPDRDLTLYEDLEVTIASPAEAETIVCTGLFDDETQTPRDYLKALTACAARDVPMICANPDLKVERGGKIIPCAGAVAALYEQLGGHVAYAGKPHLPIYEATFALLNDLAGRPVPKSEILAIGDGIKTDIAGAASAGIPSLYIASNVHLAGNALTPQSLTTLFPEPQGRPLAAMTVLSW
jgi:HAD superfamily hydrolase (TIGR01459 family)